MGKSKKQFKHGKRKGRRPANSDSSQKTADVATGDDAVVDYGNDESEIPFHDRVRRLFLGSSTFSQHLDAQEKNSMRYAATLAVLEQSGVTLSQASRPRALAAAFARGDKDIVALMLNLPEEKVGVKEIVKVVSLLDGRRAAKANAKTLKRLETQGCKKKRKMALLKSIIASLEAEVVPKGSVNKFVVREVKKWIKRIPAERLLFFASHFPTEPWKKLSDLCHLHPEKDFPQCPWFLRFCYGAAAPDNSVAQQSTIVNKENVSSLVMETDLDYSVVRQYAAVLTDEAKVRIATYTENLATIIWYYEELHCPLVDAVILKRLEAGEKLNMSYGKLMERLLMFHLEKAKRKEPIQFLPLLLDQAEEGLKIISLQLDSPVAVIGDRSSSMDVAIRTSNIIASLLAVASDAELTFFDSNMSSPPFVPKTAAQVIELSNLVRAQGCTSPAAALWPYYKEKKMVKTFVIVTDEEENTQAEQHNFGPLFVKYYKEVYEAKLVFVSFLSSQTSVGQMVNALKELDSGIKVRQFRFDGQRPDLTKLDSMLALLSYKPEVFAAAVEEMEATLLEHKTTECLNVKQSCLVL